MSHRLKKILSLLVVTIFLLLALFVIFRNPILHWRIQKTAAEIKQRTGASLKVASSSFSGFLSVSLKDISIIPLKGDTLWQADTLRIRISFWTLLKGTLRIKELYVSRSNLMISCRDSVCNYSGFLQERPILKKASGKNYSLFLKRILDHTFNFAPQRAYLEDVSVTYRNDTMERILKIKEFHSDENSLYGLAEDLLTHTNWQCKGKFSQIKKFLLVEFYSIGNGREKLPLTNELFGLSLGFDTLSIALNGYRWSDNLLSVNGAISIKNLTSFHRKISDDTIIVSSASFNFLLHSGKTYVEIDSASNASLTSIVFHPYLRYSKEKDKEYSITIKTEKIPSTNFFSSLPKGMFDEVRKISAEGTMQFTLNFKINTSRPDNLIFNSSLKKDHFRIKNFGSSNLLKMHGEFTHSVYEKDRFIRSFLVGYSNPYYVSLDSISPSFKNAVLISEDGNFYFHNGFNEDAFRKSIITNFKSGKFTRGGSTISMQLVKNVFLNRKKTIARKAEEVLLVWLIENNHLYSKERLLEVYMNIIELGPGIYGIGEASDFYFKKRPLELILPEGIFLASLLPHPKWFKYSFDTLGNLKPYLADYYNIVSDFMLKKNQITQEEHDHLKPFVILKGKAREMVIPSDTIPEEDENEFE